MLYAVLFLILAPFFLATLMAALAIRIAEHSTHTSGFVWTGIFLPFSPFAFRISCTNSRSLNDDDNLVHKM